MQTAATRISLIGLIAAAACTFFIASGVFAADSDQQPAPALTASEVLLETRKRLEKLETIDIVVRCEFGFRSENDTHVQNFRFLRDANRWARKWIHQKPVSPPSNYDICLPEGRFRFVHNPEQAGIPHSLQIDEPAEFEDRHQSGTLCTNLGGLWYLQTREYVNENAHRAQIKGTQALEETDCFIVELPIQPEDVLIAFDAIKDPKLLHEGAILRLYVAPELGYAIPRYEYCDVKGKVDKYFECSGFSEYSEGFFFPAIGVWEALARSADGAVEPTSFCKLEIVGVRSINEPIPDREFQIVVPAHTSVGDSRRGRGVKVILDEGGTATEPAEVDNWIRDKFNELRRPNPPPRFRWVTPGLVAANCVTLILLVVVYWLQSKRRTGNA